MEDWTGQQWKRLCTCRLNWDYYEDPPLHSLLSRGKFTCLDLGRFVGVKTVEVLIRMMMMMMLLASGSWMLLYFGAQLTFSSFFGGGRAGRGGAGGGGGGGLAGTTTCQLYSNLINLEDEKRYSEP